MVLFEAGFAPLWKNVFSISGYCTMEGPGFVDPFYLHMSEAGEEAYKDQITHRFCRWPGEGTRDWHTRSYEEILALLTPEEANMSLVLGLTTRWSDALSRLLRTGVAVLLRAYTPGVNLTEHGLDPAVVRYFDVQIDVGRPDSALSVGRELCRQKGRFRKLKLASIHYPHWIGDLDWRTEGGLQGYFEACAEAKSEIVWSLRADESMRWQLDDRDKIMQWQNRSLRSLLLAHPIPDVVFYATDYSCNLLRGFLSFWLTPEEAERVGCVGWDGLYTELRREGGILASAAMPVFNPQSGYWRMARKITDLMQEMQWFSTDAIKAGLALDSVVVSVETVSHDSVGQLWGNQFNSYNPGVAPRSVNEVHVGLQDVCVMDFKPVGGNLDVTFWIVLSWRDPRLIWDPMLLEGNMTINSTQIWTPTVAFLRAFQVDELSERKAVVTNTGRIRLMKQMHVRFACDTDGGIVDYPYDSYNCSISVAADIREVILKGSLGFDVVDHDAAFESSRVIISRSSAEHSVVDYSFYKRRLLVSEFLRWMLPCLLLNTIGFIAFWVPSPSESIALGVRVCWRKATRRRGPTAPETSPCDLDSLAAGDLVSASPSSPVEDLEAAPIDFDRVGRWVVVPTYYALVSYMFWAGADLM
eukprot:TRINITY_DN26541_c0_g1_i3.p1 TRINITY_DN26541_c0_g1~~TRINITY_DN26541_c0_g1_i3.p1  ORF type:complete len:668 (-),score=24.25 TRINITY_DN26541_c0_g1_i3:162-2081(-)